MTPAAMRSRCREQRPDVGLFDFPLEGQQPSPEWDAKPSDVSKQFNKIKEAIGRRSAPDLGFPTPVREEGSTS